VQNVGKECQLFFESKINKKFAVVLIMLLDFVRKLSWHTCVWEPSSKVSSNCKSYKSLARKT